MQVTVMKGSSRNKDHSTEGEGTGKRPKRKCLQWHPLLAKKLLDFSEEEEEEEEEEDIDKVPLLGADGLEQDADETEDDESSEQRARRPMNAFLLFCKRHRSLVRKEHPRLDNRGATKILADWWAVLDPKRSRNTLTWPRSSYQLTYKDAFMKANPGYKWCPTTNKPVKTQTSTVTNRKKLWAFPSDSAKDIPSPRKVTKSEEMPQLNFGMAVSKINEICPPTGHLSFYLRCNIITGLLIHNITCDVLACPSYPTQMGGLSMLLLAGEHALTAQEVSSNTCQSDVTDSTEVCQKSSLFQFAEMCLASEGVKMKEPGKTKVEVSEDMTREVPEMEVEELEKTTIKDSCTGKIEQSETEQNWDVTKAEELETVKCSKPEKLKKKKKKNKLDRHTNEKSTPKKPCKKRQSSESDIESVMYTIEAVAKGDWEKKTSKEKPMETTKESKPPDFLSITANKEVP
ncbi:UNVERIFIED_CONTAM: hypothetical protein H355_011227 [Colinus virginianus]|nr:hypothetical protein H355_011227 [Colinus virginianus]